LPPELTTVNVPEATQEFKIVNGMLVIKVCRENKYGTL